MNIQNAINSAIGNAGKLAGLGKLIENTQQTTNEVEPGKLNSTSAAQQAQVAAANRQQVYNNQTEVNRRWEEFRAAGGAKAAVGSDAKVMEILKQHGYYKKDGDN